MTEVIPASTTNHEPQAAHTHDEALRDVDLTRHTKATIDLATVAFDAHFDQYAENRDGIIVIPAAE